MKTPREILFEKHQQATPELDAITARVVQQLRGQQTFSWRVLWESLRWQRVALGSAWTLVLLMNVVGRMESSASSSNNLRLEDRLALRENRLMLRELLQPSSDVVLAPGPRTYFAAPYLKG